MAEGQGAALSVFQALLIQVITMCVYLLLDCFPFMSKLLTLLNSFAPKCSKKGCSGMSAKIGQKCATVGLHGQDHDLAPFVAALSRSSTFFGVFDEPL